MTDEQKDLEFVMDKYGRTVNGIITSMLSSPSEREDIFQEVFLLYYTKELYFPEEAARRSWLIRTAINLCKAANRSPWNRLRDGEELDLNALPSGGSDSADTGLWAAMCRLKEKYRLPLYLHYFEEYPVADIARILCVSESAVRARLTRGKEQLRKLLENERKM